jgi:hypothetical protein
LITNRSNPTNSTIYRVDCSRSRRQIPEGKNDPSVEREPIEYHKQHDSPRRVLSFQTTNPGRKEWSMRLERTDRRQQTARFTASTALDPDDKSRKEGMVHASRNNRSNTTNSMIHRDECFCSRRQIPEGKNDPIAEREPIESNKQHDSPCRLL